MDVQGWHSHRNFLQWFSSVGLCEIAPCTWRWIAGHMRDCNTCTCQTLLVFWKGHSGASGCILTALSIVFERDEKKIIWGNNKVEISEHGNRCQRQKTWCCAVIWTRELDRNTGQTLVLKSDFWLFSRSQLEDAGSLGDLQSLPRRRLLNKSVILIGEVITTRVAHNGGTAVACVRVCVCVVFACQLLSVSSWRWLSTCRL